MKVLLLHPEDRFEDFAERAKWDVIVDLAQAPRATYDQWKKAGAAKVVSLYQFEEGTEDLHRTRDLLQLGTGRMVDRFGIDWWEVLSLMLVPELQDLMLLGRVARELPSKCEVHSSRPCVAADSLQAWLHLEVANLDGRGGVGLRRLQHYRKALAQLDRRQVWQVLQDKFDRSHSVRARLTRRTEASADPVVLLPSAYVNVSRTAVAYAEMLPSQEFLLVTARDSGKLGSLPPNIRSFSLDSFFTEADPAEVGSMLASWSLLKARLGDAAAEFSAALETCILEQMPGLIRWGIAMRDAWINLFANQNIVSCLCADDTNPYTRIPLILATTRGLPTLACHHGALDARTAFKTQYADWYLAKNEMERDYLVRSCRLAAGKVIVGAPAPSAPILARADQGNGQWLVYFSEPYGSAGWRAEEIYRDLLPRLVSVARASGMKLVFKLHPFESVKGHRRMLRNLLGKREERNIEVIGGPPSAAVWENIRCAITVQSTIALECASMGVPVFLCEWLRDPFLGYQEQFLRSGIGQALRSPSDIDRIPDLLSSHEWKPAEDPRSQIISPEKLRQLLTAPSMETSKHQAVGF